MVEGDLIIRVDDSTSLRLIREEDTEAVYEAVTTDREHLRTYLDWVERTDCPEFTLDFIRSCREGWERGDSVQTTIWHDDRVVGGLGTVQMDLRSDSVEIGYWLGSDHEGRGVMCRCCRAFIDYLFRERGFHRIVIRAAMQNLKSRAVAERLGFTLEGTLRESYKLHDEYVDTAVYSLLEGEWDAKGVCDD